MGSSYRWVIVAVGALMTCVAVGAMFSLAVFLEPMSRGHRLVARRHLERDDARLPRMGVAGFGWGAVERPLRPASVVLIGAVLLGLGLVLASRATSLLEFQLTYGVLVGLAAGAFFAPMIAADDAVVRHQPQPCRVAGLGRHGRRADDDLAVRALADLGLRLAHRACWRSASLAWVLLIPAALLVRQPPAAPPAAERGAPAIAGAGRSRRPGAALAAVHRAGADLLRCAARRIPARSSTW